MFEIIKVFKDILAPKKCYSCKKEWHFLCEKCLQEIWFFESICPICKQTSRDFEVHFYCKNESFSLEKIIILTHYQNKIIKKLIKDAKFYGKKDILEDFSFYLTQKLLMHISEKNEDILLLPTPMYFLKKLRRGYNQSGLLIQYMARKFWFSYNLKIIKKRKSTLPQSHLSKIERIENLRDSFYINENELLKYKNKTFILVDDVLSTWTTLNELAKLLKRKGVKTIYWLCIASD